MNNKKGILISLSGFDGVGKSTQVELLTDYYDKRGNTVKTTESMFGYFLLKPLIGCLRRTTKSPSKGPVKRNNNILLKLWFFPAFADIWLAYIFRDRNDLRKFDILIADRYYTDIWANLLYYGYISQWAFRVFVKLIPKPDKGFVLLSNVNNVLKREKEFEPSYYHEQAQIYKNLAKTLDVAEIDASKSVKNTFNQIIGVLSNYEK